MVPPPGCFIWSHSGTSPTVLAFSNPKTAHGQCQSSARCICAACDTVLKSSVPLHVSEVGEFDLQIHYSKYGESVSPCKSPLRTTTCASGYRVVVDGSRQVCRPIQESVCSQITAGIGQLRSPVDTEPVPMGSLLYLGFNGTSELGSSYNVSLVQQALQPTALSRDAKVLLSKMGTFSVQVCAACHLFADAQYLADDVCL